MTEATPVITAVRNPIQNDCGGIYCEIQFDGLMQDDGITPLFLPYTASAKDNAPFGPTLFEDLNAGKYGTPTPYTPPDDFLSIIRQEKYREINQWRDREAQQIVCFDWNGHRWEASDAAMRLLALVLQMATEGLPDGFFWTDADNNDVSVTPEDLKALDMEMTKAMVAGGFRLHQRQRDMKKAVDGLPDIESIRNFPVGW